MSKVIGCINELIPRTKVRLKIFDPTIFPSAISQVPFLAATTLVISSGNDVPSATANSEINALEIPKEIAIVMAESTSKLPPKGNNIHPSIKKDSILKVENVS